MQVIEPRRVIRTYTQKINAHPGSVFPLLCPVREAEWVKGWNPSVVFSNTGFAERDCIFLTGDDQNESCWIVTEYDPYRFRLEMIKVNPGVTVGRVSIGLRLNEEGTTDALVTYMYTALSRAGEAFIESYTEDFYVQFMKHWESSLNEYLESRKV